MQGYLTMRVSPLLRIVITRSVALVPALAVALISSGSTGLDSLNQGLNLVRVGAVLGCGCGSGAVRLRDEQGSVRAAAHRPLDCGLTRTEIGRAHV